MDKQSIPYLPSHFVSLWGSLSDSAHTDMTARIIRQMLYIWHWNIIPLLLLIPAIYLYFKSNRRNLLLSISVGALFLMVAIFYLQDALFDIKIQRFYFYLSPFVFFLTGWCVFALFKNPNVKRYIKKGIMIGIACMILITIFAIPQVVENPYQTSRYDGLIWTGETISPTEKIASIPTFTQESRGCGIMNIVVA